VTSRVKVSEIPKKSHFAVLIQRTEMIYHEGDERSRTHPGHGYPAYTQTIESIDYYAFEDDREVLAFLRTLSSADRAKARVISATPMEIKESLSIVLDKPTLYRSSGEK